MMTSVPLTVTSANYSHHGHLIDFLNMTQKSLYVCFSHRWICYRVSGEDKQWDEMCLETHVCQQWAWSPGVQERNTDNGKAAPQTWDCLFKMGRGTVPSHEKANGGLLPFPEMAERPCTKWEGTAMECRALLLPWSLLARELRRKEHSERTDQFSGQRNSLRHWEKFT